MSESIESLISTTQRAISESNESIKKKNEIAKFVKDLPEVPDDDHGRKNKKVKKLVKRNDGKVERQ